MSIARTPRGRRGIALFALGLAISGAGIYLAVHGADAAAVADALGSSEYSLLAPAFALLVVANGMRAVRWQLMFAKPTRPAFAPTAEVMLVGQFFNCVLPMRAGEAVRLFALHARAGTSRAEILGTLVLERAFDILALLGVLFVALPWLPAISWLRTAATLGAALALALGVAILVLARWGTRPFHLVLRPLARLPFLGSLHVEGTAESLARGLATLRSVRLGLVAFGLTVVSWIALAASFWFAAVAVAPGLPFEASILIATAIGLALVVPSGPAAVGIFEASVISALSAYDVPHSEALSAALVVHAINVVPYLVTGGAILLRWSRSTAKKSQPGPPARRRAWSSAVPNVRPPFDSG